MFFEHFIPKFQKTTQIDRTHFESFRIEFKKYEILRNSDCKKPNLDPANFEKLTSDLLDTVFGEKKREKFTKERDFPRLTLRSKIT